MADDEIQQGAPENGETFEKKVRKPTRSNELKGGLNINSMMDIMTIMLVFLLVSITSDPLSIKQDDYLKIANSTVDHKPEDSVPITVTKQAIIVDHKNVVKVDCAKSGQICQGDDYKDPGNTYSIGKSFKEDGSEASFMIEPLHKRLEEIVKQQKEEAKELGREFKPVATIICDHEIPYRIISEVVYTIGMAGLSDLRFAVFKGGKR